MPSPNRIFISYAKEDHKVAKQLYDDLKNADMLPWMDTEDLLPGQTSEVETDKAIKSSDYFLILLSANSVTKAGLVHAEIRKALKRFQEFTPGETYIIPVRLDDCEPAYEELQALHPADIFPSYEKGFKKILKVLLPDKKDESEFLQEAKVRDIDAAKQLKEAANKRMLSAAEAIAKMGDLKNSQLKYREAAAYFKEAAELVPEGSELILPKYLSEWGIASLISGNYAGAKYPLERSLAISEKILGMEHPDIANSLNNLAVLYKSQGKYDEAESLYKRSLAIKEKVMSAEHPDLASSLNNLAIVYRIQGKYDEAEPLYNRSLAIREKIFGTEHPDVAHSLNSLALLYKLQEKYNEAEPLYKRALAIREKVLVANHPDLATSLNNLAQLYIMQNRYDEADPLHKRALAISEKIFGTEHPDVALSLHNISYLYRIQGKYDQAAPLQKRALTIREKILDAEHPDVAESLNGLALIYYSQGKYDEAEPLYERAYKILLKKLGEQHQDTKRIKANMESNAARK